MKTDTGKAPRARRRKEARPGEIIEAGLQEFAARGYAAARLEDVANRAGVVKGTIYRYFDDKEALFMAAVRSRVTPVFADVDGFVDTFPGTTRELLGFMLQTVYSRVVDSDLRVLVRIIIAEGGNFPGLTELYHRETLSRGRALLAKIVQRGIARGEVRPGPTADLPIVLLAPAMMAVIWKLTFDRHEPIETEKFFAAHVDLVFNGLWTEVGRVDPASPLPAMSPHRRG